MFQDEDGQASTKPDVRQSPISFIARFFRLKRSTTRLHSNNGNADVHVTQLFKKNGNKKCISRSTTCIPSALSTKDIFISSHPPSPALSIPSRNKNIDHDMEALKQSRQDDPFLKVLASRESLAESYKAESEFEFGTNASQVVFSNIDPFSIPEFHKHMVRSPPPLNWPRSPVFKFKNSSQECLSMQPNKLVHKSRDSMALTEIGCGIISPTTSIPKQYPQSITSETRERKSNNTFSLIPSSSFRSLSEVRRLHLKSSEENQLLVSTS